MIGVALGGSVCILLGKENRDIVPREARQIALFSKHNNKRSQKGLFNCSSHHHGADRELLSLSISEPIHFRIHVLLNGLGFQHSVPPQEELANVSAAHHVFP